MKVITISTSGVKDLDQHLNEYLSEGWKLYGNLIAIIDNVGEFRYIQQVTYGTYMKESKFRGFI